jgi:redox-sensitive bicupin YhaK (pirin superfamily)
LYAGEPVREPVVAGEPFVMNTDEQIWQAFQDLETGSLFRESGRSYNG